MKKILILLGLLILVSGCVQKSGQAQSEIENLKQECIQACQQALKNNQDLSEGPCLLDPMENEEWVCDVAHTPRQSVDNKRENQCNAWYEGTAKHFIEVTPECKFIKAV